MVNLQSDRSPSASIRAGCTTQVERRRRSSSPARPEAAPDVSARPWIA